MTRLHLHARVGVRGESPRRAPMQRALEREAVNLAKKGKPFRKLRQFQDWNFEELPELAPAHSPAFWTELGDALAPGGPGLDVGIAWTREEARSLAIGDLLGVFRDLSPLYKVLANASWPAAAGRGLGANRLRGPGRVGAGPDALLSRGAGGDARSHDARGARRWALGARPTEGREVSSSRSRAGLSSSSGASRRARRCSRQGPRGRTAARISRRDEPRTSLARESSTSLEGGGSAARRSRAASGAGERSSGPPRELAVSRRGVGRRLTARGLLLGRGGPGAGAAARAGARRPFRGEREPREPPSSRRGRGPPDGTGSAIATAPAGATA